LKPPPPKKKKKKRPKMASGPYHPRIET